MISKIVTTPIGMVSISVHQKPPSALFKNIEEMEPPITFTENRKRQTYPHEIGDLHSISLFTLDAQMEDPSEREFPSRMISRLQLEPNSCRS
jgi:hypothetical protein